MLTKSDVEEVFKELLGRPPRSKPWIEAAIARHHSRESLAGELRKTEEFRKEQITQARAPVFRQMFLQPTAASSPQGSINVERLRDQLRSIQNAQGEYQPVYGLGTALEKSPRLGNLSFDCAQIEAHFASIDKKGQVRILDVGCNLGYITFKLAEQGYNILGIDIDPHNIQFCSDTAAFTGSSAKFRELNFLELAENGELDWENVDCILLLNVVHQFIFARGINYTKALLRRLAARVDVLFLELAVREDYIRHGKDHLLPNHPNAVLADCQDCDIQVLKREGRPLYKVTRRAAVWDRFSIRAERIFYSESPPADISRKYLCGERKFLKVFRYVHHEDVGSFHREVQGLLAMKGSGLAPEIFDWVASPTYGAVLMEEIGGIPLTAAYRCFSTPEALRRFVRQYLQIAQKLSEHYLYHNDLAAHNLRVLGDGSIFAIDFEQTSRIQILDAFGVLLWTIYDILAGENVSYYRQVYGKLYEKRGISEPAISHYPDFTGMELPGWLALFLTRTQRSSTWFEFVGVEATKGLEIDS